MKLHKRETIVIGGTLEAFVYSYFNNLPVVFVESRVPYPFEFFSLKQDLSRFFIESDRTFMKTPVEEMECFGNKKEELFVKCGFHLSMVGNNPACGLAELIRIEDDKLCISTTNGRLIEIEYDKLIVFDDEKITGLPLGYDEGKKRFVVDWFDVRSGCRHGVDIIRGKDDFVKEVYFYPSSRIDMTMRPKLNKPTLKDAVAVSYLTSKQIESGDFSDVYSRFKTKSMMKEAGILGFRRGKRENGKIRIEPIRLELAWREIRKIKMNKYKNTERVKFNYQTVEEILKDNESKVFEFDNAAHMTNVLLQRKRRIWKKTKK